MDEPDPPFYPSLSRTNSGMSDVSSAQSTSSQASDQSDRTPTQDDLLNDNWAYLRDYFVMTATPDGIKTLHTSAFYAYQLTYKSRLARQHILPSRAISRIITYPNKLNSLL